jgi:cell division GTPase FtsZ
MGMGTSSSRSPGVRAVEAARSALSSPLLDFPVKNAKVNIIIVMGLFHFIRMSLYVYVNTYIFYDRVSYSMSLVVVI